MRNILFLGLLGLYFVPLNAQNINDTLTPQLEPPFLYWDSANRIKYEAVKFYPERACSVFAIMHGVIAPGAASKQCSLFIWNDINGYPGTKLLEVRTTAETDSTGISWNVYTLPSPIYIKVPFWVGNYEMDTLFPTTRFDTMKSLPSQYNFGTGWFYTRNDYFLGAVVKYDTGGASPVQRTVLLEELTSVG
ncbi:MAG: hypothetical protein WC614_09980 [bacterium]